MYVTKEEIKWYRSFSAISDPIIFPKGTRITRANNIYWVSNQGIEDRVVAHDLIHYGCRVSEDKVEEI